MANERTKRSNIYFRQTPKEFRAQKQTEIYEHINKNIPYKIFFYTKERISSVYTKVKGRFTKFNLKLPKNAKSTKKAGIQRKSF